MSLLSSILPVSLGGTPPTAPTVPLSYATVVGFGNADIDTFNGIPFAQPPIGQLRLKPPQPITSNLGTLQLPSSATACPQFYADTAALPTEALAYILDSRIFQSVSNAGEDCLTIDVQRPAGVTKGANLPVIFWMYGGGFEFGSTQIYGGSYLIENGVNQKQPIMFVAVNYRVGAFGFMGGKELTQEGSTNIGLLDQRMGLEWVADNIEEFGGDPEKVTIWGESAGSISVFDQMALYEGNHTYKGKPLFRAAIMDSGSQVPAGPSDSPRAQSVYDTVVRNAGCQGKPDTLTCLRSLDYPTFLTAANSVPGIFSYSSVALSYLPRPDGRTLTQSPERLVQQGKIAPVPFIVGDQEDEGTLFALLQTNLTTTDDLVEYLSTVFFPQAPKENIAKFVNLYPDDPAAGSPFNTGTSNQYIYPQYKRTAAMLGDLTFTLSRRLFLNESSNIQPPQKSWSYLSSYNHDVPLLGTSHASDIPNAFDVIPGNAASSISNYYLAFVVGLDPNFLNNATGEMEWPVWKDDSGGQGGGMLMNFGFFSNGLTTDDFRREAGKFMAENPDSFCF